MKQFKAITMGMALALAAVQMSHAQHAAGAEFGIKAGVQMSDIAVSGLDLGFNLLDPQMTPGVTAGLYAEIPMGGGMYFSPELNYTQKGFKVYEGIDVNVFGANVPIGAEAITKLHYLEVPLALKYKFGNGATNGYLKAGPTVGYALSGTVNTRINSFLDFNVARIPLDLQGDMYNTLEVGAMAGAGFEVRSGSGKFFADVTFQHGLTDLINEPVVDLRVKNQSIGLGVGYALHF
ncbi:MAG: porin family protein [Saprospiraceae bacterium]|nr:porin family protein [Saprospiraceae bacterium]